jgi:fimbrial chaperone protein
MSSNRPLRFAGGVLALICALAAPPAAQADSLAVSPTRLTVAAPAKVATMTIKAEGKGQSVVQIRVMAWNPSDDPGKLSATKAVSVSPPAAKLRSRQELTLRIIRTDRRPVRRLECYRVLIDRLPAKAKQGQAIQLQVRQSVPLCFTP